MDLSIVVPVYCSADCLEALVSSIDGAMAAVGKSYEVILVNDNSPDDSWKVISALCTRHQNIIGLDLRKNFGQDSAILTGFRFARGAYIAVMDDDLQHDPADLPRLLQALRDKEADVVYASFLVKRQKLWKNVGSWFTDLFARWVVGKPRGVYMSPYKVLRREIVDLIRDYEGPEPYIDGLIFQATSRVTQIPAHHNVRFSGQGNFTFAKSVATWGRLAFSFSVAPLRVVTALGVLLALIGLLLTVLVVAYRLFFPARFSIYEAGWTSLMVALLVIGGAQMFFIGILGEYVGRTFLATSRKPQTAIASSINAPSDTSIRYVETSTAEQ
ncbi:MAG: glycosyltransferase family 2 protein [Acidobacteriaceae bacterium]|nr:glycosyltransferase family 2 protein [Acidobacteriaceae bacterium]